MAVTKVSSSLIDANLTISGGTVDNTVIGSGTPAAGTFTTISGTLASSVTGTTQSVGDGSTKIATTAYADAAAAAVVDSAPSTLDTLNELAAALGDDPNFATTVTNSIAAKAPLSNPTFTGTAVVNQLNIDSASYDNRQLGIDSNGFFIYNSADARYDMVISDAGNAGIGTTATTGYSSHTNLFLGGTGNIYADTGATADASLSISQNAYFDADGSWETRVSDEATNYYQSGGTHGFRVASSTAAGTDITWRTAFLIKNNGSLTMNGQAGSSPIFEMVNNDNEDNDTGRESSLRFSGHRSGGEDVVNAQISGHHDGSADDDKGMLFFYTNNGSGLNLAQKIDSSGNVDIGSPAGSEKLNVAGSITADGYIYPTTDNGWSLGLSANRWGNVYAYNGNFESTVYIGPGGGVSQLQIFPAFSSGVNLIQNYSGSAYTTEEHRAYDYNFKIANLSSALFINASGGIYSGTTGTSIGSGNIVVNEGIYVGAANGNNQIRSSSAGGGSATLYIGNAAIQVSSDQRLKTNIVDTEIDATAKLNQVRVVDFNWDDPSDTSFNNRNARGKWTGVLAQELVDVLPFAVNAPRNESDLSIDTDSEQKWLVDQAQMVPVLIKAIQELTARIEELENN